MVNFICHPVAFCQFFKFITHQIAIRFAFQLVFDFVFHQFKKKNFPSTFHLMQRIKFVFE